MSAYIKRRATKDGKARFLVYYRRSSGHREAYGGSFTTKREAEARRDLIKYELANLRDPALLIDQQRQPAQARVTLASSWAAWMLSKKKSGLKAHALYANSRDRWLPLLGATTDPARVTVPLILVAIDELLDDLAPATVSLYKSHLAMVLDFALPDGTPNPARSKKIELPAGGSEKRVPSNEEWAGIVAHVAARSKGALRLMECCGFRVSEACGLEAGDVDTDGGQVLVRRAVTKTTAGRRWVPVPAELAGSIPLGVNATQVYYDLQKACEKANVREFGTHAFRRRRISLWYRQGIDGPQIARWAGHAKASESMDTYAFEVMDALADEWFSHWQEAAGGGGRVKEAV